MITDHKDVLEIRYPSQSIFDRLRRDLLAAGCHQNVFFSIVNYKKTVPVDFADISGMKPAAFKSFHGVSIPVIVALHDIRTTHEDLTVFGDADFLAPDDPAYSSQAHRTRPVQCNNRRSLAQTVPFVDRQPHGPEELRNIFVQGGTTRNEEPHFSTEPRTNLLKHGPVGRAIRQRRPICS